MTVATTALETMNNLLDEMRPFLLVAGIPKEQIHVRSGKHRADALSRAFDWLHDFKMSSEYVQIVYVRGLLPEEIWNRYILHGIEGLREQILLELAKKPLLKRWRKKRPAMFNKNRNTQNVHKTRVGSGAQGVGVFSS